VAAKLTKQDGNPVIGSARAFPGRGQSCRRHSPRDNESVGYASDGLCGFDSGVAAFVRAVAASDGVDRYEWPASNSQHQRTRIDTGARNPDAHVVHALDHGRDLFRGGGAADVCGDQVPREGERFSERAATDLRKQADRARVDRNSNTDRYRAVPDNGAADF
jgi:hypothetical protein